MLPEIFKLFWKTVERKDARRINSQTPPTEIEQFCDIQYIDDGLWQHRLDVYSKSGKLSHCPVIIDIVLSLHKTIMLLSILITD